MWNENIEFNVTLARPKAGVRFDDENEYVKDLLAAVEEANQEWNGDRIFEVISYDGISVKMAYRALDPIRGDRTLTRYLQRISKILAYDKGWNDKVTRKEGTIFTVFNADQPEGEYEFHHKSHHGKGHGKGYGRGHGHCNGECRGHEHDDEHDDENEGGSHKDEHEYDHDHHQDKKWSRDYEYSRDVIEKFEKSEKHEDREKTNDLLSQIIETLKDIQAELKNDKK